eukprot:11228512-Alexandrium_andersonii.AAC.1
MQAAPLWPRLPAARTGALNEGPFRRRALGEVGLAGRRGALLRGAQSRCAKASSFVGLAPAGRR